ncbi:unnamed protein product, partial [marine sediment metagenome]
MGNKKQKSTVEKSENKTIDSKYTNKLKVENEFYLEKILDKKHLLKFNKKIEKIGDEKSTDEVIEEYSTIYEKMIKEKYQKESSKQYNHKINGFINDKESKLKIIWGNCLDVLKKLRSESIHHMVTSPPYYNAREYSTWPDLNSYLDDMREIIREAYRVLENHRVFVFNIGDIFDNDNLTVKSVWGKRRLPLAAYFIKIFEEEGFTFVDGFIWDKG